MRFSTGKRDVEDAKRYACEAFDEAKYRERLGFALMVKRFDEIAKYCCEDMRRDLAAGVGKKVYTAYIAVIETYLVPFFGQMFLTSITHKQIAEFEEWRNEKLKRKPKTSTLLTFASAFSRICATAVEQGWVSATAKFPKLNVRGERGGVRPAFTDKEVTQLREHPSNIRLYPSLSTYQKLPTLVVSLLNPHKNLPTLTRNKQLPRVALVLKQLT
jgi:hypothetical protein